MEYWNKRNEIIKRCWAVNNAVDMVSSNNLPLTEKELKKWYDFFYNWHSDWDIELEEADTKKPLTAYQKQSLADDKVMEEGQDAKDKKRDLTN